MNDIPTIRLPRSSLSGNVASVSNTVSQSAEYNRLKVKKVQGPQRKIPKKRNPDYDRARREDESDQLNALKDMLSINKSTTYPNTLITALATLRVMKGDQSVDRIKLIRDIYHNEIQHKKVQGSPEIVQPSNYAKECHRKKSPIGSSTREKIKSLYSLLKEMIGKDAECLNRREVVNKIIQFLRQNGVPQWPTKTGVIYFDRVVRQKATSILYGNPIDSSRGGSSLIASEASLPIKNVSADDGLTAQVQRGPALEPVTQKGNPLVMEDSLMPSCSTDDEIGGLHTGVYSEKYEVSAKKITGEMQPIPAEKIPRIAWEKATMLEGIEGASEKGCEPVQCEGFNAKAIKNPSRELPKNKKTYSYESMLQQKINGKMSTLKGILSIHSSTTQLNTLITALATIKMIKSGVCSVDREQLIKGIYNDLQKVRTLFSLTTVQISNKSVLNTELSLMYEQLKNLFFKENRFRSKVDILESAITFLRESKIPKWPEITIITLGSTNNHRGRILITDKMPSSLVRNVNDEGRLIQSHPTELVLENAGLDSLSVESAGSAASEKFRVEEEKIIPGSPGDAALSVGSDVANGDFSAAATLISEPLLESDKEFSSAAGLVLSENTQSPSITDWTVEIVPAVKSHFQSDVGGESEKPPLMSGFDDCLPMISGFPNLNHLNDLSANTDSEKLEFIVKSL